MPKLDVKAESLLSFTLAGPAALYDGADLETEFFDGKTDFGLAWGNTRPVHYDHGANKALRRTRLGIASVTQDDEAVWFEAEIAKSQKYAGQILALAKAGLLGASIGPIQHLTERKAMPDGRTYVAAYPIGEISLTVVPMEPRMVGAIQAKALLDASDLVGEDAKAAGTYSMRKMGAKWAVVGADNKIVSMHPSEAEAKAEMAKLMGGKGMMMGGAMPGSFEDYTAQIRDMAGQELGDNRDDYAEVCATYADHAIVHIMGYGDDMQEGTYYRVPYTVSGGDVTLGTASEVVPDFVPAGGKGGDFKAVWDTAYVNNLKDSAFLAIEDGGSKDSEGKTTPRSLRHFPVYDSGGNLDKPHLRNALARIPQSTIAQALKDQAHAKALRLAQGAGIDAAGGGKAGDVKHRANMTQADMTTTKNHLGRVLHHANQAIALLTNGYVDSGGTDTTTDSGGKSADLPLPAAGERVAADLKAYTRRLGATASDQLRGDIEGVKALARELHVVADDVARAIERAGRQEDVGPADIDRLIEQIEARLGH